MARPIRGQQIELEEAIKTTAWKQIAEQGAASLSLRAIGRELGISAPAIYNYYPRRDDLVSALINDAFTSLAEALETARDAIAPKDHAGRFRAVNMAYRQWAVTYPQRYRLIFGTPIAGYEVGPEAAQASQRSLMVLAGVIDEAYQAGAIRPGPGRVALTPGLQAQYAALTRQKMPFTPVVLHLTLASWSWIHGLASLELYGYFPRLLADRVEEFIHLEVERFMRTLGTA
jgi:AcrR family transcriptional regulator